MYKPSDTMLTYHPKASVTSHIERLFAGYSLKTIACKNNEATINAALFVEKLILKNTVAVNCQN